MSASTTLSLDRLPRGLPARITRVGHDQDDSRSDGGASLEDLLLGLGFEEGADVEVRHQGPFGGPLAVRVDGRMIALRPADAAAITVEHTPIIDPTQGEQT